MIAVLDTGGVDALATVHEGGRARVRLLRRDVETFVVPAAVLAEGLLTGNPAHDVPVHRLLRAADITDVTERLGRTAGDLRQVTIRRAAGSRPSGVDAIVAAVADQHAAHDDVVIVTSDPRDLVPLTLSCDHASRISVEVV